MLDLILLFVLYFLILFFSAISGGSGLLTTPLLIFFGLSPAVAASTKRIASVFIRIVSIQELNKTGHINWKQGLTLIVPSVIGGVSGAYALTLLSSAFLTRFVGFVVLALGLLTAFKPTIGTKKGKIKHNWLTSFGAFISNMVGTMVGGAGILFTYFLLAGNHSFISAAGVRKVASFLAAVAGAAYMIVAGLVDWYTVPIITVAGCLGIYFGTHYNLKKGNKWVRVVMLVIIAVTGIKLFFF